MKKHKHSHDLSKGFTIIELLVVVAIITILAGMLLPALMNARERAYEAICFSNLKEIGVVSYLYQSDHDDFMPAVLNLTGGGVIYPTLNAIMNEADVFWCPASGEDHRWDGLTIPTIVAPPAPPTVSYGFNFFGVGYQGVLNYSGYYSYQNNLPHAYKKNTAIIYPSNIIAATDSTPQGHQHTVGTPLKYNPARYGPSIIHHGGSVVLFGDGHVTWMSINDLSNSWIIWNDRGLNGPLL